jgi:nucleotide-binding universal stress UspA family protein
MKTFNIKIIVIPTDFSEAGIHALEQGASLSKLCNAELHLVHVFEPTSVFFPALEPILALSVEEDAKEKISQKMSEVSELYRNKFGIKVVSVVVEGKIAAEIVKYAEEKEADLILMGTHGASGYEEFFIGSNAEKVLNKAQCPVLTIQAHSGSNNIQNIVVPIDGTLHSRQKVDYAIEMAKIYGSTIHLLGLIEMEEDQIEKFRLKMRIVEEVVQKAGVPYVEKTIVDANVAQTALDYAKEVGADLIIVMADHESMIPGLFTGKFGKHLVNHSAIPVMSIKPHLGSLTSVNPAGSPSYAN